jgi:hypothetical protein
MRRKHPAFDNFIPDGGLVKYATVPGYAMATTTAWGLKLVKSGLFLPRVFYLFSSVMDQPVFRVGHGRFRMFLSPQCRESVQVDCYLTLRSPGLSVSKQLVCWQVSPMFMGGLRSSPSISIKKTVRILSILFRLFPGPIFRQQSPLVTACSKYP